MEAGKPKPAFPLKLFHLLLRAHPLCLFRPPETLLGSYSTEPSQALLRDNNFRQIIHRSALSCKRGSVLQQRWRGNRCVALRLMGMARMSPLHAPSSWCLGPNHLSSPRRMPPKMPGLGSGEGWSCQSHQRGQTVSSQAVKLLFRPAHHEKVVAGGRARRQVPAAGGKQPGKDCAWCSLEASVPARVKMAGQLAH